MQYLDRFCCLLIRVVKYSTAVNNRSISKSNLLLQDRKCPRLNAFWQSRIYNLHCTRFRILEIKKKSNNYHWKLWQISERCGLLEKKTCERNGNICKSACHWRYNRLIRHSPQLCFAAPELFVICFSLCQVSPLRFETWIHLCQFWIKFALKTVSNRSTFLFQEKDFKNRMPQHSRIKWSWMTFPLKHQVRVKRLRSRRLPD